MEINSIENLCKFLISCAFQRCRLLDDACRVSVSLIPAPPLLRVSVSDTGIGSTLEEFQKFRYSNDILITSKWDGVLCVVTTSISDKEIHLLKFDCKVYDAQKRWVRLPSISKDGANYSGTEVSLSLFEETDSLLPIISEFIRKMLLVRTPRIAVEFSVVSGGNVESQSKSIILQTACNNIPMDATNIDFLKLAFEDYVSKHGNRLLESCHSCFSTGKDPKIGAGIACSSNRKRCGEQVMEVVIIISEISVPVPSSCIRLYSQKTEAVYFRDFFPCPISESCRDALSKFPWKKYGLALKNVEDEDGTILLEWDNLPPGTHIDIVLHRYSQQAMILPLTQKNTKDTRLTTKAVKLALSDLKEKSAGALLSQHATKICSYAPDLAKTISGLILSSHDRKFQSECFCLLGLSSEENAGDVLEKCIKDKITHVVTISDVHPKAVAPLLFANNGHHEARGPDDDCCDEAAAQEAFHMLM